MTHLCDYGPGIETNNLGFIIDASPIYTELSGSVVLNGSYTTYDSMSNSDREFVYDNVEFDFPVITRIYHRDPALNPGAESAEAAQFFDSITGVRSYHDKGFINSAVPEGRFLAIHGWQASIRNPSPFDTPVFIAPNDSSIMFFALFSKELESVGTVTITPRNGGDPTVKNIGAQMLLQRPYLLGSIEGGDLELIFTLSYRINIDAFPAGPPIQDGFEHIIDASAWSSPQLRDIRGTYGATETDERGLEYTWSLTIA